MKSSESKYFIALIPKEPLASSIYELKKQMANDYASKAALKSPAHLTLHMPFVWKERNEARLISLLVQASTGTAFNLYLDGFGAFPPRTIFIRTKISAKLNALHEQLTLYTKRELKLMNSTHNRGFYPHITIAFRDLRNEKFDEAWQKFQHKAFEAKMEVNSFWLLKHDGSIWQAIEEFPFD